MRSEEGGREVAKEAAEMGGDVQAPVGRLDNKQKP